MNEGTDEYTEPPEDVRCEMQRTLTMKVTSAQTILDTLRQVDEFLRRCASRAVHAELDAFCAAHGRGTDAFLDSLGFEVLSLRWAIDAATNHAGEDAGVDHDKETT